MKRFLPIMFYLLIGLLVFIMSINVAHYDFDLWARLIAGMGVVDGHEVLKADFLSYTPTHIWYDHEYGSGTVFYFVLKHFGAYGLIILQSILLFLMFFIITKTVKLRGVSQPYNFLFWLFPLIALAENLASPIRCHLFSFLFFAVFIYVLELYRNGKTKIIYILPLLTVVWNNLHGGVVSGIGLVVLYAIGEFLNKKSVKHYVIVALLSLLVLVINPWGVDYIKFLFMANSMNRADVAEWWSIFSTHQLFNQIPFKIFMFLAICLEIFMIKLDRNVLKDKTKFVVLGATLFLAIQHVKLLPFFVIAVSCFCYEDFKNVIENKLPDYVQRNSLIIVLIFCVAFFSIKKLDIPLGAASYPHREVEFIKLNKLSGNVLANFGIGSFVAYKLYPQNLIFMDGRYEEVYYDEMVPLLKKFYLLKPDWDEVLRKYPPDIMIIEKIYPVYYMLNKHKDWANVYETETFAVYVKRVDIKASYIQPTSNQEYYKNTLFDTSVKF